MAVEKGKVFTGVRCRFMLDGRKVGYGTGVDVSEAITYEPVKVLDDIITQEFVPTDYDVELTAAMIRIVGQSLKSQGYFPKQGSRNEDFLKNILDSGAMTLLLEDNKTGTVVAQVSGVKIARRGISVQARGIVGENVSMVGTMVRDESDASPTA